MLHQGFRWFGGTTPLMLAAFPRSVIQSLRTPWPTSPFPPFPLFWPHLAHTFAICLSPAPPILFLICLTLLVETPPFSPHPLLFFLSPLCPPPPHLMLFHCCCLSLSNNCTPVRAHWVLFTNTPRKTHTTKHTRTHTHTHVCTSKDMHVHTRSTSSLRISAGRPGSLQVFVPTR